MADDLFVKLGADIAPLERSLTEAQRKLSRMTAYIKASSREEIEIARSSLREKEALFRHGVDVNLRAARLEFAQRSELARAGAQAQIRALRSSSEQMAKTAAQTVAPLRGLNEGFLSLTRSVTGLHPVVGRMTDVLGTMAVGAGPAAIAIAGVAALTVGIHKLTEASRKSKEEVEQLLDRLQKLAKSQEHPLVGLTADALAAGKQLERAREVLTKAMQPKIQQTFTPSGRVIISEFIDRGAVERAQASVNEWEKAWGAALRGIRDIATKSFEEVAEASKRATEEAIRAEEELTRAMLEQWRMRLRFLEMSGLWRIGTADQARVGAGVFRQGERVQVGQDLPRRMWRPEDVQGGGGFVGRLGGQLGAMLDPEMIVSGLATGFLSQGINLAISGIGKVVGGLFGLGGAAEEAARRMQAAVNNIRLEIARMRGDTATATFFELQAGVQQRLETLGLPTSINLQKQTPEELLKWLEALQNLMATAGRGGEVALVIEWLKESMKNLGDEVNRLADSLRNIPQGYKIALAAFNATTPSAAMAGAVGVRPVVINIDNVNASNPREFLDKVEQAAVQKLRSGGVLAWDLDV